MNSCINVLYIGIMNPVASEITEAIRCGLGDSYKISIQVGSLLNAEQANLSENYYQMIIIHPDSQLQLITQLKYIRKFDFRIQIILLINQVADFFLVQKYNIAFIIRNTHRTNDLCDFTFALRERYQNKQFYMPHQQRFLSVHSIYYLESSKNYIQIYTMEGCFRERFTIKELTNHQSFEQFLLISQSILLHPLHMSSIDHEMIIMRDGRHLFISRGRIRQVYQKLNELQQL